MIAIIEANEYNEIHTISCPECKSHLEEDAFLYYNCRFANNDAEADMYEWVSIKCPTNRGMIVCSLCDYKFIIDPYKPPKTISHKEIKLKYPYHDNIQNRKYWSDLKGRGYGKKCIKYWEIYLAKINKCFMDDSSPNNALINKKFDLCSINVGYGSNCDMYNEASSTYFRCVSQTGKTFDYEYYHD